MTWRFADGTTVELGGTVEGPTLFAQLLREDLERGAHVTIWPQPSPPLPVDVNDPALMNAWLEHMAELEGVKLTEAPDNLPELPPAPYTTASDAPADAIY